MPDITMCEGASCPKKRTCYRYLAEANEYRQTFFREVPYRGDDCEYYWNVTKELRTDHE